MLNLKVPMSGERWRENRHLAIERFRQGRHFLFSAYPDADALGTMLALGLYLRLLGKKATLFFPSPLKANLQFMKDIIQYNNIAVVEDEAELKSLQNEVDTVVFCDTAHARLVPLLETFYDCFLNRGIPSIEIDHHFGTDSAAITETGVHLFRKANASTEIAAELLQGLHRSHPELPVPFEQRNIVISLLMGMLTDTFGGRAVPLREDYDHWSGLLGDCLKAITQTDDENGSKNGGKVLFRSSAEILAHLNRLNPEQERYVRELKQRIVRHRGVGELNLLDSSLAQISGRPLRSGHEEFFQVWNAMANVVPKEGGKVGLFYFNGKNAEGRPCIFLKIRRAFDFSRFDLRECQPALQSAFGEHYLGGGGHAGAVSFRVLPMEESRFRWQAAAIVSFLEKHIN